MELKFLHTKEGLVLSTIEVLSENGLQYKIKNIFNIRISTIQSFIDEGKRLRVFQIDLDSENLTDHHCWVGKSDYLKWRMNNYNFSLKEHTLSTLKLVLDAFGNFPTLALSITRTNRA